MAKLFAAGQHAQIFAQRSAVGGLQSAGQRDPVLFVNQLYQRPAHATGAAIYNQSHKPSIAGFAPLLYCFALAFLARALNSAMLG